MKRILFLLSVTTLYVLLQLKASANVAEDKEIGIPLNQAVPALSALGIDGTGQNLAELAGTKGSILIFYRSADWCPFCKRHLIEFNKWVNKFSELGYNLVGISYDSINVLKEFTEQENIEFALVADQNNQTIKDFKVLNTDYEPGQRHYGIPYPGVMVVNTKGILTYNYFYEGYKQRVKIADLYEQLKSQ